MHDWTLDKCSQGEYISIFRSSNELMHMLMKQLYFIYWQQQETWTNELKVTMTINKQVNNTWKSFIQTYCSNNHVFTDGEPKSYCRLNTADPVLQLYSDEAADHRVHRHLSLLSIMSLTAAVRLNLIMEGKGTSRLSLPECTERMRKTMMTPPYHTQSWTRAGEHVWENLAAAPSAPDIYVPALYENNYL